jgi:hypothetical protein
MPILIMVGKPALCSPAQRNEWTSSTFLGMHVLKFFLFVGPALTALLFAWSAYLEPEPKPAQPATQIVSAPEPFRPTPAPPVAEQEPAAAAEEPAAQEPAARVSPPVVHEAAGKKGERPKSRKVAKVRRSRPTTESYAYSPQPFFFGWQ